MSDQYFRTYWASVRSRCLITYSQFTLFLRFIIGPFFQNCKAIYFWFSYRCDKTYSMLTICFVNELFILWMMHVLISFTFIISNRFRFGLQEGRVDLSLVIHCVTAFQAAWLTTWPHRSMRYSFFIKRHKNTKLQIISLYIPDTCRQ